MEVRKDFGKRVEALAKTTPTEAISNLLLALLPREPVRVRVPDKHKLLREPVQAGPSAFRLKAKLRTRKPRKPRSRTYEVLHQYAHLNHRCGTWRAAMVEAVIKSTCELSALEYMREHYPHLEGKGVDIAWCESTGYIKY